VGRADEVEIGMPAREDVVSVHRNAMCFADAVLHASLLPNEKSSAWNPPLTSRL
jgi:hypothetical protein